MTNKEDLLESLKDVVLQLVLKHGVTRKNVKLHIYKCLADAAVNLPKTQVVYNDVYGGFGYSSDFESFAEKHNFPYDDRSEAIETLLKYGEKKYNELPSISRLITSYILQPRQSLQIGIKRLNITENDIGLYGNANVQRISYAISNETSRCVCSSGHCP
jgi:hypothetical protein